MKITKRIIATAFILVTSLCMFSACADKPEKSTLPEERETIYQVSTINSLLLGNFDGFKSVGDLKNNGDLGIGTFDTLDGELIMIDNKVFKAKSSGEVVETENSIKIPFAAVTRFDKDVVTELNDIGSLDLLTKEIDKLIENRDLFYAIRIDGVFKNVKVRSVAKQKKPYPLLSEVTKDQVTFEYADIKGSLVGFWCPEYVGGINVPGYHLHFISDDRTKGGHLLEVGFDKADVALDITEKFKMQLTQGSTSGSISDLEKEIDDVE